MLKLYPCQVLTRECTIAQDISSLPHHRVRLIPLHLRVKPQILCLNGFVMKEYHSRDRIGGISGNYLDCGVFFKW